MALFHWTTHGRTSKRVCRLHSMSLNAGLGEITDLDGMVLGAGMVMGSVPLQCSQSLGASKSRRLEKHVI